MTSSIEVYECPYCGKIFRNEKSIVLHIVRAHSRLQLVLDAKTVYIYFTRIERLLRKLSEKIEEQGREIEELKIMLKNMKRVEYIVTEKESYKDETTELPSFVKNNPWIKILRKRTLSK